MEQTLEETNMWGVFIFGIILIIMGICLLIDDGFSGGISFLGGILIIFGLLIIAIFLFYPQCQTIDMEITNSGVENVDIAAMTKECRIMSKPKQIWEEKSVELIYRYVEEN
jgi:membrane-bound ClpP family serine protease